MCYVTSLANRGNQPSSQPANLMLTEATTVIQLILINAKLKSSRLKLVSSVYFLGTFHMLEGEWGICAESTYCTHVLHLCTHLFAIIALPYTQTNQFLFTMDGHTIIIGNIVVRPSIHLCCRMCVPFYQNVYNAQQKTFNFHLKCTKASYIHTRARHTRNTTLLYHTVPGNRLVIVIVNKYSPITTMWMFFILISPWFEYARVECGYKRNI